MTTLKNHEELDAWQLANALKVRVLEIVKRPAVAKCVRLCDDIERSSSSAPANLSEGFWKYRPKEKAFFVRIAIGSLGETQNHLRDARDRKLIEDEEFSDLITLAKRALGASISWHSYLMSCPDKPPAKDKDRQKSQDGRKNRSSRSGTSEPRERKPKT